jgi:hypothetical protein
MLDRATLGSLTNARAQLVSMQVTITLSVTLQIDSVNNMLLTAGRYDRGHLLLEPSECQQTTAFETSAMSSLTVFQPVLECCKASRFIRYDATLR